MRTVVGIAAAILVLGLVSSSTPGQALTGDARPLDGINMIDTQTGWAFLRDSKTEVLSLLRTTDGGTHWEDVTPLDSSGRKINVSSAMLLSASISWVVSKTRAGEPSMFEIFRTTDGGRTWRSVPNPAAPSRIAAPFFVNPREGWLIAPVSGWRGRHEVEIYHSADGGETWKKVSRATEKDESSGLTIWGDKGSITFLDSRTGWITVWVDGYWIACPPTLRRTGDRRGDMQVCSFLYITHDGGQTWRPVRMPLPETNSDWGVRLSPPKFFTALDGIMPVSFEILRGLDITRRIGGLYTTHDGGETWTYRPHFPIGYVLMVDTDHGWAWDGVVLRATSDGGLRWRALPKNPLFSDVRQFDFVSPQSGWVIRTTSPYLLTTSDGGLTWTPVPYKISRR